MNREQVQDFREKLSAVLEREFPSMRIKLGNMSFTSEYVKLSGEAATGRTQAEADLEEMAKRHGLMLENSAGERLVEYSRRARKYPYIMRGVDGKNYKLTVSLAQEKFS